MSRKKPTEAGTAQGGLKLGIGPRAVPARSAQEHAGAVGELERPGAIGAAASRDGSRSGEIDADPGGCQRRDRAFGSICQTLSGKSEAALILPTVSREFGECTRPRYSLRASSDRAGRPSSVRSAMFIATTTPEHPAKLRWSGIQGRPPPTSGIVPAGANTCRSYGAWPTVARLAINMALLTELPVGRVPSRGVQRCATSGLTVTDANRAARCLQFTI